MSTSHRTNPHTQEVMPRLLHFWRPLPNVVGSDVPLFHHISPPLAPYSTITFIFHLDLSELYLEPRAEVPLGENFALSSRHSLRHSHLHPSRVHCVTCPLCNSQTWHATIEAVPSRASLAGERRNAVLVASSEQFRWCFAFSPYCLPSTGLKAPIGRILVYLPISKWHIPSTRSLRLLQMLIQPPCELCSLRRMEAPNR